MRIGFHGFGLDLVVWAVVFLDSLVVCDFRADSGHFGLLRIV